MTSSVRFGDVFFEGVDVPSTRDNSKPKSSAVMQTETLVYGDKEVQSFVMKDSECQTETARDEKVEKRETGDLAEFLKRVERTIVATLESNLNSKAFDGYTAHWQDARQEIQPLHRLRRGGEGVEVMPVSALSWNATGHMLAVSFGKMDHSSLCTHTGVVWCWNLTRKYIKETVPDLKLEAAACGMCLAFHPTDPTLLACGTFNGGLLIWRVVLGEENVEMENVLTPISHREPVTTVAWIHDPIERNYKLLSVAGDGKVMLWTMTNSLKLPLAIIDLAQEGGRAALTRGFTMRGKIVGGTALQVSVADPGAFIVVSEGGGVFRCLVNFNELAINARRKDAGVSSTALKVSFAFEPHSGPVTACSCSPFSRHVFATTGMDGQVRLYNTLRPAPVMRLEPSSSPLHAISWSPSRHLVLVMSDESGSIFVYDLMQSTLSWKHRLVVATGEEKPSPIYSLCYNHVFTDIVVAGDANGFVRVWQLSSDLADAGNDSEQAKMNVLMMDTATTDAKDDEE